MPLGFAKSVFTKASAAVTYTASYLVVAGGASGGCWVGGGGGAGGYRTSYSSDASGGGASTETPFNLTQGKTYTITVGAGGAAVDGSSAANADVGNNGTASSISGFGISTVSTTGGGGGGCNVDFVGPPPGTVTAKQSGLAGGSGGGAGRGDTSSTGYPTYGLGGAGTANEGYAGGTVTASNGLGGQGGGGAGEAGDTDGDTYGGDGVVSTILDVSTASTNSVGEIISGTQVWFAGGGAGCNASGDNTNGGLGGGGDGIQGPELAGQQVDGDPNTGGGGGGQRDAGYSGTISGAGGSGCVILRMPTADYSGTTTGSPTVATIGSDTVIIFKGSGSYTA